MWCHNCGQDVPRVASPSSGELCCLRCGRPTTLRASAGGVPAQERGPSEIAAAMAASHVPTAPYDGWELEEQLRHIGRRLGSPAGQGDAGSAKSPADDTGRVFRIDAAHVTPRAPHVPAQSRRPRRARTTFFDAAAWLAVLAGLTGLSCGSVLMVWSLVTGRVDLWTVGVPVALVGLGVLALAAVVGFLLWLDQLGNKTQRTEARLAQVDGQLHRLETTASLLGASHASPSGAFYGHLADGASPHLLLSDLKSQLDLLAVKITAES